MRGLTPDGELFDFAKVPRSSCSCTTTSPPTCSRTTAPLGAPTREGQGVGASETAGAGFSPDGKWLFVHLQYPGETFAITGPWDKGWL